MKKVLIVFTDPHLAYSPSTLNLYDSLANDFDVTILSFEPDPMYSLQRIENRKVKYIIRPTEITTQPKSLFKRIKCEIKKTINHRLKKLMNPLISDTANALINEIKQFNGEIIAVDFFALWSIQQTGRSAHLLSLELFDRDGYRLDCDMAKIKSVIIQSESRYKYLFNSKDLNYFIVQNAPKYIDTELNIEMRNPFQLIFCGSAMPWFGIFSCIEFLCDYPEYILTIKGAVPPFVKNVIKENFYDLLESKRLILDEVYLSETELNEYLQKFYIGFVFYDHYRFDSINTFNYKTAPSGKLFQYYNAGIPVICNSLEGLDSVNSLSTGISINSMSSLQIKRAIENINLHYEAMSMNAKKASKYFDFSINIKHFVDYFKKHYN